MLLSFESNIHPTAEVVDSKLGLWTEVGPNCKIVETVLGDYSYVSESADIIYTHIGKFCSIASYVRINPGDHPMHRVMQHHATYRRAKYGFDETDDANFFNWRRENQVVIGHDVWIGHGAIILKGIHIGTGAVVGAGSIVTKDIEPFSIVAGNPAKPLRKRFSKEIIDDLIKIAWWDWSHELIKERLPDFNHLELFIEKYKRQDSMEAKYENRY